MERRSPTKRCGNGSGIKPDLSDNSTCSIIGTSKQKYKNNN
jgi:hypothetical protein